MFGGARAAEQREEEARTANAADVDVYFKQIRAIIKHYRRVVDKLEALKKDKKKAIERMDLVAERCAIRESGHGRG